MVSRGGEGLSGSDETWHPVGGWHLVIRDGIQRYSRGTHRHHESQG